MGLAWRYSTGSTGIGSTDTAFPDQAEEVNLFGTPAEVTDKIKVLQEDFSTDGMIVGLIGRHLSPDTWS